jgi:hypothetical protein
MIDQESWFEFGEKFERQRVLQILDILEGALVESEEDAKMTLHIVRKLVEANE